MSSLILAALLTVFALHISADSELDSAVREVSQFIRANHAIRKRQVSRALRRLSPTVTEQPGSGRSQMTNEKAIMFIMKIKMFIDERKMEDRVQQISQLDDWKNLSVSQQAEIKDTAPLFAALMTSPKPTIAETKAAYVEIDSLTPKQLNSVSAPAKIFLLKAQRDLDFMKKWVSEWRKLDGPAKADLDRVSGDHFVSMRTLTGAYEAVVGSID